MFGFCVYFFFFISLKYSKTVAFSLLSTVFPVCSESSAWACWTGWPLPEQSPPPPCILSCGCSLAATNFKRDPPRDRRCPVHQSHCLEPETPSGALFPQSITFLCWAVVCKVVISLFLVTELPLYNKNMGFGMGEGMTGLWKEQDGQGVGNLSVKY